MTSTTFNTAVLKPKKVGMGGTRRARDPQGRHWTVRASLKRVPVDAFDRLRPGWSRRWWRLTGQDIVAWPLRGTLRRGAPPIAWVVEAAADDAPETARAWVVGRRLKARGRQLDEIVSAIEAGTIDEL